MFDDITFLVRYGPQIRIRFGGRTYIVETPIIPTPDGDQSQSERTDVHRLTGRMKLWGRARDRKFADSPLEGAGFELSIPRQS